MRSSDIWYTLNTDYAIQQTRFCLYLFLIGMAYLSISCVWDFHVGTGFPWEIIPLMIPIFVCVYLPFIQTHKQSVAAEAEQGAAANP